jgi:hypothetical protein
MHFFKPRAPLQTFPQQHFVPDFLTAAVVGGVMTSSAFIPCDAEWLE